MYRFGFGSLPRGLYGLTDEMAAAIAQFEGFNTAGSVAQRNNNPGNLRSGTGQTGTDSAGYAIFPSVASGYAALDNQINLNVSRGLTLDQFFGGGNGYPGYAPSADSNNPAAYAAFVASQTGIPESVPLNQLPAGTSSNSSSSGLGPFVGPPDVFGTASSSDSTSTDPGVSVPSSSSGIDPLVLGGLALGILGLIALAAA